MDIKKNFYYQRFDLISIGNSCVITIFHLFASILLLLYALTSLWYLQQMWSPVDNTYEMSLVTQKFTYSIRSLLLLSYLQ
ncbi:unnamed protein product [Rotaria magnacalcarata]|uniref:Uncharacterized protein n=1 Tax=Rotaria magnacalcarata TaxID=392030 RepID=A0A816Z335_9BILA|nr:unnamed protein product [Rotaria magnacalcarata]CAF1561297.1 unnamed protein product [Rotaria magnacalcarata]CAF2061616.1 unnamed protein product [Rotaria magnacalcarata]CAF2126705.1 unnamed protein product [Rotaria magnacalcarata]CAF2182802.1 unnamed protein product [Rotaria magnacalcarata]